MVGHSLSGCWRLVFADRNAWLSTQVSMFVEQR